MPAGRLPRSYKYFYFYLFIVALQAFICVHACLSSASFISFFLVFPFLFIIIVIFLLLHYSFCGLSCGCLHFLVFPIFSVWEGGGRGLAWGGQGEL